MRDRNRAWVIPFCAAAAFSGANNAAVAQDVRQIAASVVETLTKGPLVYLAYVEYPEEIHRLKRRRSTIRGRLGRMQAFVATRLELPALRVAT